MATSAKYPGSYTAMGGDPAWSNPDRVLADDGSTADCTWAVVFGHGTGTYAEGIKVYNFGFAVPTGSSITSIVASLEIFASNSSSSNRAYLDYNQLQWTGGSTGSVLPNVTQITTGPGTIHTYTWNSSLPSVANLNSSELYFESSMYWSRTTGSTITVAWDRIYLTVTYDPPYGNKVDAVTSMGSVMGVSTTSISKVFGA